MHYLSLLAPQKLSAQLVISAIRRDYFIDTIEIYAYFAWVTKENKPRHCLATLQEVVFAVRVGRLTLGVFRRLGVFREASFQVKISIIRCFRYTIFSASSLHVIGFRFYASYYLPFSSSWCSTISQDVSCLWWWFSGFDMFDKWAYSTPSRLKSSALMMSIGTLFSFIRDIADAVMHAFPLCQFLSHIIFRLSRLSARRRASSRRMSDDYISMNIIIPAVAAILSRKSLACQPLCFHFMYLLANIVTPRLSYRFSWKMLSSACHECSLHSFIGKSLVASLPWILCSAMKMYPVKNNM